MKLGRRWAFRFFVVLCWLPLLAMAWIWFDWSENRGFQFGYWGELNKIVETLDDLEEVDAVWVEGYNADVTLEEVNIGIETVEGERFDIWFGQNDPIRKLTGSELSQALATRLAELRR